jgi:hypothetical protein
MWEIQILLIRDTESLAEDAGPLTDAKKVEFADKIRTLDCIDLLELAREDCAAWRGAILAFLVHPPASGFDRGHRIAEILSDNFIPILVALGITEQKAREDLQASDAFEYPEELAGTLGGALNLEKAILLLSLGFETECPEDARLEAYTFVVYQALALVMYGKAEDGKRPIRAQAALLAMDPVEISERTKCDAFLELHACLMKLSWAIIEGDLAETKTRFMESFIHFSRVVKDAKLSDQDIIDAGGKMFLDYVRAYRSF